MNHLVREQTNTHNALNHCLTAPIHLRALAHVDTRLGEAMGDSFDGDYRTPDFQHAVLHGLNAINRKIPQPHQPLAHNVFMCKLP